MKDLAYYNNRVSDEFMEFCVTELLTNHPDGMTERDILIYMRSMYVIPYGKVLDHFVVNSYLYRNQFGRYKRIEAYKPIWRLRNLSSPKGISQTDDSIEALVAEMADSIVKNILELKYQKQVCCSDKKLAEEEAKKLLKENGNAITDMVYWYFNKKEPAAVQNKVLFCVQKLALMALNELDDLEASRA